MNRVLRSTHARHVHEIDALRISALDKTHHYPQHIILSAQMAKKTNIRHIFRRRYYNGRACHNVASVCRHLSSVTLCFVAKRCVLEQTLLLTAYRKSYMRNRLVPE